MFFWGHGVDGNLKKCQSLYGLPKVGLLRECASDVVDIMSFVWNLILFSVVKEF